MIYQKQNMKLTGQRGIWPTKYLKVIHTSASTKSRNAPFQLLEQISNKIWIERGVYSIQFNLKSKTLNKNNHNHNQNQVRSSISIFMDSIMNKLRNLDAYPKINEDFYSRTLSGGLITIVSSILMLLLFFSELRNFSFFFSIVFFYALSIS